MTAFEQFDLEVCTILSRVRVLLDFLAERERTEAGARLEFFLCFALVSEYKIICLTTNYCYHGLEQCRVFDHFLTTLNINLILVGRFSKKNGHCFLALLSEPPENL